MESQNTGTMRGFYEFRQERGFFGLSGFEGIY